MTGVLYVVATPIGNLRDITRRAEDVLKSVAMIAAEDTRRTRVLLEAIGADGPQLVALHAHNESAALARVLERLADQDVALVSDAGTPLLSDPGFELVRACWQAGIDVIPVPGASAILAVLSVCPLPVGRFRFEGFLPARAAQRRERLQALAAYEEASVIFEAPHRIAECLRDLATVLPDREVMIGREMTKRYEQYLRGTSADLLQRLTTADQLRGEFVIVLTGATGAAPAPDVRRTMDVLARELPPAQAARIGAELLGVGKRELYALALELRGSVAE
ncbi:MAG: 16S rRNA (cytidine(1402)-2'-O)-methyltransferase [Pseudomonadales bacterium]|nr:16S rRNA (cytidine(1402)-2'-O)-methyltransferase [Pseudomonadales bacterium]